MIENIRQFTNMLEVQMSLVVSELSFTALFTTEIKATPTMLKKSE